MIGVSTDVKNITIEDCGLARILISRRLLDLFGLTESENKPIGDLITVVALLEKALAVENEMDRKLNKRETGVIMLSSIEGAGGEA